ncbi:MULTISPECIES: hypothetical protein [Legionella]|uniref:Uncharacterized protein n=1 Tax=Legionella drozanskii LLAP-1 TaxID=1212489 RepID=A0A0W0SWP0_9GAMM|nr:MULTISPECIES: hypothetical protein [Legionella]KTC87750.1 hypothetical protein Ldro_1369 [Legionella drozanskii LLAP-1]PJE11001.1 MAG: hypothetical protein CK430_09400 [Legionella sp.]
MQNKSFDIVCNILFLLPYAENAALVNKHQKIDDLYLIRAIVDFSIRALELFIDGNLQAFDPQIGENLCQIRAYKLFHLSKKWLSSAEAFAEFHHEIERFKRYKLQIEDVICEWENAIKQAVVYNKQLDGVEKISGFLSRHQLLFNLQQEFAFIIACNFLTHFNIRKDDVPIAMNLEHITREFHISKYRARRLTYRYQQLICRLGCLFIQNIAQELPAELGYTDILPKLCLISDEDRMVLPCYTVSQIIFYHSIQKKIPVLLLVQRIPQSSAFKSDLVYFLLVGKEGTNDYDLVNSSSQPLDYCMVIAGEIVYEQESIEHYIQRVLKESPLKIILANTAIHPQYSGKRLETFRNNPFLLISDSNQIAAQHRDNLMNLRRYALESGCSQENRTLFFLRHIYATKLKDEIKQLQLKYQGEAHDAYAMLNP